MDKIALAVNGVCGRMGHRVVHLASETPGFFVAVGLESKDNPKLSLDLGEVMGLDSLRGRSIVSSIPHKQRVDAVIDFSSPAGVKEILITCLERKIPLVVATTGLGVEMLKSLKEAAHEIPVLLAPNLSLGMNLLMKLLSLASRSLREQDFDVEIVETHHRFKKDAPSGTALRLAQIIQEEVGDIPLRHGREGITGERPKREIGLHAIRAGDNVGEHTILFSTLGETLELTHKASSRDAFAKGALEAAKFLSNQAPGWYTMADVLQINLGK